MNPVKALRRHPFLVLTGLLLVAAALWVGYFLATFDLDHYRDQIAGELGSRLQMPVQLGAAHVEMREAGIAFRFDDVRIGTPQTRTQLSAARLWLQLAWHGLLLGKPVLTEVALDTPHLRIRPTDESPAEEITPHEGFRPESLSGLQVQRVEIHRGAIDFAWHDPSGGERVLSFDDLSVEVADFGAGRTAAFDATASLVGQGAPTRLALNGSIDLPASGTLAGAGWDVILETKDFEPDRVGGLLPDQTVALAGEKAKLTLLVKGQITDGLTFQADLTGKGLHLRAASPPRPVMPVNHLQISGSWQQAGNTHHFRQLVAQLDELKLTGEFSLTSTASGRQISGQLGDCTLPFDALRNWMPPALRAVNPVFSRRLPGGLITLSRARFHAETSASSHEFGSFFLEELHGEAKDLNWDLGKERKAELKTLTFHHENGRWQFHNGSATVAGLPLAVSGTLTPQAGAAAQLAVEVNSNIPATWFATLWPEALPPELALAGELHLQGRITGTPEHLAADARLDLAPLDVRYGDRLHLPPTPDAVFSLQGEVNPDRLTISRADLALPPFTGQLSGTVDWKEAPVLNLTARLELPDLTAAYDLIPALGKLQPGGGAALDMTAAGSVASIQTRTSLQLHDVAIPAHGIVADISRLNGLLLLENGVIRSEKLTARIGRSPVILQARVPDLKLPRLELGVKAAGIRADELIFYSDRVTLRDISGQLFIDSDGIDFAPVNVRLDNGTRATVRGSVSDFDNPRVELDITGEYANVKEIIGLWTDESPAAEAARKAHHAETPHRRLPPISIRAEARQGDLFGMTFTNARALIVPTSEHLLIHPLDFKVGEGYCTTQVLVDYSGRHSLLRVSGHVENVDAYEVVNELLKRKSLMRGSLRGDFYLQGELGEGRFLPTSFGNINATVRDGVMRHSPVLGTVFSLLNVSQLFSFKLPDVNLEGVPFTRVAAELAIDKGILSSDLIVIDSEAMNMSYVGQYDMVKDWLNLLVVVKPLGTIDKVVTSLPIAGWILGGEEQALITAQFKVTGPGADPDIEAIPISSMSRGVLGIFQRTLSLPLKLVEDPAILWGGGGKN